MARRKKSKPGQAEPSRPRTHQPQSPPPEHPPLYLETANPPRRNPALLTVAILLTSFWLAFLVTMAWYASKG